MEKDLSKLSIKEFYPLYLAAHKHPWTKIWHFLGQFLTIGYIWFVIWAGINLHWIAFGYLFWATEVIYLFAWPSHKYIEMNRPLGKDYKWKSKICDWLMFWDVLIARKQPLDGRNK